MEPDYRRVHGQTLDSALRGESARMRFSNCEMRKNAVQQDARLQILK
jgi:hypothetical protein